MVSRADKHQTAFEQVLVGLLLILVGCFVCFVQETGCWLFGLGLWMSSPIYPHTLPPPLPPPTFAFAPATPPF